MNLSEVTLAFNGEILWVSKKKPKNQICSLHNHFNQSGLFFLLLFFF